MKNLITSIILLLIFNSCIKTKIDPVNYVDPFIDSHKSRWFYFSSASRLFLSCLNKKVSYILFDLAAIPAA